MKLNKLEHRIILLTILLLCSDGLKSCECLQLQPFLNNIDNKTYVSKVEILEHGVIEDNRDAESIIEKSRPTILMPRIRYHSYTKLKISENLLGSQKLDTVIFLNAYASTCNANLSFMEVGSEFIIRYKENIETTDINEINHELNTNFKLVSTSDCINWKLGIDGNTVIGNIFTSRAANEVQELHRRIEEYSKEELKLKFEYIKTIKQEEIDYSDLVHKLNKIEDALYNTR